MADPISLSTATIFSAITTTFKLAEFCLALKEVSSESRIFLTLIERVRKDRKEALRERHEKSAILQAMPGKRAWIDDCITDVDKVLYDIGILIESARVDVSKGNSVTLKHRFEWVLSNHQKFVTREMSLSTCHASLLGAISAMHTLGMSPGMLSPTLNQQNAPDYVSPFASSTSLASTTTLSPPPGYESLSASDLADIHNQPMIKSPSRRRPKVAKAISAPPQDAPSLGHPYQPRLRHQYSNSSIQESILDVDPSFEARSRSFSDATSPEIPPLNFSTNQPSFAPTGDIGSLHSRAHSNSVPSIVYQHHDSVSSVHSDGSRTSFPYFDSSIPTDYFELAGAQDPPSGVNSRRATDPPRGINNSEYVYSSTQSWQGPPSYSPVAASPWYSGQDMMEVASDAIRPQNEGSFGTPVLAESLRLSSAQERRRRARARFGMGTD